MIKRILTLPVLAMLVVGIAACGGSSSKKLGSIVLAPSGGRTSPTTSAATTTPTSSTPTTPTTTVSTPKPPSPLAKEPVISVPKGNPPTKLVVKDLIKGTGPAATSSSSVSVNYVGALYSDGKVFDASWKRNQTFPFTLGQGQVIPGWDQGIPGMKVGGRRELIIPPSLAYKSAAQPGIPANSTLVFVVDLLSVS